MGVLMVRKEVKRRTSLLLGISLSLLLGAAAAFFLFALPQDLLESLTTSTGLARIMVQAEPPISPNDRALLSTLAGIGTAGLGWVLIDWLLFGRAGISALIKPREDDYEEDEGDYYRPSNPLDLVVPDSPMASMAAPPPPVLDPRRPLSARTDIGDPPTPLPGAGRPEASQDIYNIALNQLLPPIEQLLPDAPPIPTVRLEQADAISRMTAALPPELGELPLTLSEDTSAEPVIKIPGPLILPTAAEIAAAARGVPLPQPAIVAPEASVDLLFDVSVPARASEPASGPTVPEPESLFDPAAEKPFELPPIIQSPPPPSAPVVGTEALSDIFASFPPNLPDASVGEIPFFTPVPDARPNWPGVQSQPEPLTAIDASPPVPTDAAAASLDGAPLGDLLARLERGMQRRRPTSPPPIALESFLPAEPARRPLPVYAAAPAQMIDPPPPPVVAQDAAPVIPTARPVQMLVGEEQSGLLDQPLHVALDVLRNRVRRTA
jgi:hypothetical protein